MYFIYILYIYNKYILYIYICLYICVYNITLLMCALFFFLNAQAHLIFYNKFYWQFLEKLTIFPINKFKFNTLNVMNVTAAKHFQQAWHNYRPELFDHKKCKGKCKQCVKQFTSRFISQKVMMKTMTQRGGQKPTCRTLKIENSIISV